MKKFIPFLLAMVTIGSCTPKDSSLDALVDSVYDRLTLEEKAAQLYGIYPGELLVDGKVSLEKCREILPYGVGHICQPTSSQDKDADQIREMVRDIQDYLMNETRAGIPAIFHEEALTGLTAKGATAYPQAIGIACTWNPNLVRTKTERTAAAVSGKTGLSMLHTQRSTSSGLLPGRDSSSTLARNSSADISPPSMAPKMPFWWHGSRSSVMRS